MKNAKHRQEMNIVYEATATIKMKILGITSAPRRESRQERKAKSSRATEQGIAGHKAAMDALRPNKNEKDEKNGN